MTQIELSLRNDKISSEVRMVSPRPFRKLGPLFSPRDPTTTAKKARLCAFDIDPDWLQQS